jgi:hypothetical protein
MTTLGRPFAILGDAMNRLRRLAFVAPVLRILWAGSPAPSLRRRLQGQTVMRRLFEPDGVRWPRVVGTALIATGVLGMLLSFAGMIGVGFAGARAERALMRQLATLDEALITTADGLTIASAALDEAERTLDSLGVTIGDATVAISDTQPTLSTLRDLTGTSLPQTIGETRAALESARATAALADNVLGALSFVGLSYNPEVPLSEAIGGVSASLAMVPTELADVTIGLEAADGSLARLTGDLDAVAEGIEGIAGSVEEGATVVERYQESVAALHAEVRTLRTEAPIWVGTARWGSYFGLVWLALAQIALLVQGWQLLERAEE